MHGFQRSRGRIVFEVLCAVVVSASFAMAWLQTGASAFVPAAAVAALYGFVHLFDLRTGNETVQVGLAPSEAAIQPIAELSDQPGEDPHAELAPEVPPAEPAVARASKPRRPKAPRKAGTGRAKAAAEQEPEAAPVHEVIVEPEAWEPVTQIPIAPLFEPDPFVRQQRATFGRKAG